jgi:transcriptional regulator with XRE-family HTH domain
MSAPKFTPVTITRKRKALGWSIDQTAVRADISSWHLLHIEHGDRLPSLPALLRLADVLGIHPGELFGTDEAA